MHVEILFVPRNLTLLLIKDISQVCKYKVQKQVSVSIKMFLDMEKCNLLNIKKILEIFFIDVKELHIFFYNFLCLCACRINTRFQEDNMLHDQACSICKT